jgi:hypothetical protein
VTNPFDINCPKELFTPTDFKAEQEGTTTFTITSNVSWTATSDQPWCKTNITSGKGNSPIISTFEANQQC